MTDPTRKYSLVTHPEYGFLQIHPTPGPDEITRFYTEEFYTAKYPAFNNSALEVQEADREFHDAHRQDICDVIEAVSGRALTGQSVLDVGCGWGQALLYFASKGAICYGFDPAPEAVEYARSRRLNCVQAGMDSMDVFGGRRFDVVTLLNVLEHLADPVRVLRELRREILVPGGVLVVEVPNEFNAFQIAGQRLHGLPEWWVAPPAHLNYFNASTLSATLQGAGYEVRAVEGSFPLEMFLLMGENYVADKSLGRRCHERRMAFESNLRRLGFGKSLRDFYRGLAASDLGRQIIAFAVDPGEASGT